mmetsp:Transcript_8325/g.13556  ORF Transcript_8325/g.13556 Transcript_8325/m.13556 type:complete len:233 (+) Transcript_8325:1003-1701(+)
MIRVTWHPLDTNAYEALNQVGYVSACLSGGSTRLVSCMVNSTGAFFVTSENNCTMNSPSPDGLPLVFYGGLGTARILPTVGLVPLYRCYIPSTNSYDVAVGSEKCTTPLLTEALLGYVMRIGSIYSTFSLNGDPFYDPTYDQMLDNDDNYNDIGSNSTSNSNLTPVKSESLTSTKSESLTIGIGIGAGCIGLALLAAVVYVVLRRYRRTGDLRILNKIAPLESKGNMRYGWE